MEQISTSEMTNLLPNVSLINLSDLPKKPPMPFGEDSLDSKPDRPEFPKLRKTNAERPPPPSTVNQTGLPVKLKPVAHPPDDITKKSEPPPPLPDSKPVGSGEDKPKPPIKKSPPSLPKKPKPKPLDLPVNPERPPTVMRHVNGLDKDPAKRHSAAGTPSEKPYDVNMKRHSQGTGKREGKRGFYRKFYVLPVKLYQ